MKLFRKINWTLVIAWSIVACIMFTMFSLIYFIMININL